jgi:hypothetical protein
MRETSCGFAARPRPGSSRPSAPAPGTVPSLAGWTAECPSLSCNARGILSRSRHERSRLRECRPSSDRRGARADTCLHEPGAGGRSLPDSNISHAGGRDEDETRRPAAAEPSSPRATRRGGDGRCVRRLRGMLRAVHHDGRPSRAAIRDRGARRAGDGGAARPDGGRRGGRHLPPWTGATTDRHPGPSATQPATARCRVDRGVPVLGQRTREQRAMSESRHYEFQAIDRPLDARARRELRACSTRATITSTRFVNHYEWGDLQGDPLV